MRRTTISRSDALVAASLALGLAAPLLAQEPTPVAQRPAVVVVQSGHTLWGIAEAYLGDPLLWPAIYRLNTDVVEDPHWIYPGEELRLGPGPEAPAPGPAVARLTPEDTTAAAPAPAPPSPAPPMAEEPEPEPEPPPPPPPGVDDQRATVFRPQPSAAQAGAREMRSYMRQPYRPVRRGEFYGAGFLTEGERLPFGRVLGNVERPSIRSLSTRSSAKVFGRIAVVPPRGATYQIGDDLWILRVGRELPSERHGNVVIPVGIARVIALQDERVIAEVTQNFGRIVDGLVALPLEPFVSPGAARPVPVEDGLTSVVIGARDGDQLLNIQDALFIDLGTADGLSLGDHFEVVRGTTELGGSDEGPTEEVLAVVMIVHMRQNTSTGFVLAVRQPDIPPGTRVRLVRKMPS